MGMFYRTIRMLEYGIKPVYVFDGKPPHLKSGEVSVLWPRSIILPLYMKQWSQNFYTVGFLFNVTLFNQSIATRNLLFDTLNSKNVFNFTMFKS